MNTITSRTRSPNFPIIDLGEAVEFASKLERLAKRQPYPVNSVIKNVIDLTPGSSRGFQYVGALIQFGLVQDEGSGESRLIRLTEEGAKIVHNHPDRPRLLKEAVSRPKVYANILNKFGSDGIPPNETIKHYLLFEHEPRFNSSSVDGFLEEFRKSIDFAGLGLSGIILDNGEQENVNKDNPGDSYKPPKFDKPKVKVGMKQEISIIGEHEASIQWPEKLTASDYEDLEEWLNGVLRKAKRTIMDELPKDKKTDDTDWINN